MDLRTMEAFVPGRCGVTEKAAKGSRITGARTLPITRRLSSRQQVGQKKAPGVAGGFGACYT